MKIKYREWIDTHVGACELGDEKVTLNMQSRFPELHRVYGYYYSGTGTIRRRWWLVDEDDEVIDPTAHHLPCLGTGTYNAWDNPRLEPSGVCVNCGRWRYDDDWFCGDSCRDQYTDFVMKPKWFRWFTGRCKVPK